MYRKKKKMFANYLNLFQLFDRTVAVMFYWFAALFNIGFWFPKTFYVDGTQATEFKKRKIFGQIRISIKWNGVCQAERLCSLAGNHHIVSSIEATVREGRIFCVEPAVRHDVISSCDLNLVWTIIGLNHQSNLQNVVYI